MQPAAAGRFFLHPKKPTCAHENTNPNTHQHLQSEARPFIRQNRPTMDDAAFIIGLMKTETDALGFIPSFAIEDRWIPSGRYIIQRDRRGRRRGYLLHGPARKADPLYVNQVCIDHDHRLKKYATAALAELYKRATQAGCSSIRLRCAADLEANAFWTAAGFLPVGIYAGGKRRDRQIIEYKMDLTQPAHTMDTPQTKYFAGVSN